ncbi:MAG: putative DNA binding domain-containing protein, partial [Blastocatellia bacterium]|nr:putative DNA binding domain-containing protein [Blastocatellia bacterium]
MPTSQHWDWLKEQPESQFLERKSCYTRSKGRVEPRSIKEVLQDVAESLAAMANADGGTVAVGLEDDGAVSGVPSRYDFEKARQQLNDYVRPRLRFRTSEITLHGQRLWVFETDWSAEVHQLSDGRYLLRVGEHNLPFPAGDVEAMKNARRQRPTEMQYQPDASLDDIDLGLVEELAKQSKLNVSPEETLVHFRLAERVNAQIRLTLAALLALGKDPARWHPRCGIEFIRWSGTERKTGADLNIEKRIRIEDKPLVRLIEEAYRKIREQIPERQRLVDLFFEEKLAYPEFAWQEAIVNAVAHRDYNLTGIGIEVHLFDDRMEIWSPGELVEPITIERLQRRERFHASRNPRMVRILTEFGYMRELGEGIPRMFEVMEREWLQPPEFRLEGGRFVVTLRSTPMFRPETMHWLKRFEGQGLSRNQMRLLAYAHEHGDRFTSRAYQKLVGADIYTAARDIKDLIRRGVARLTKPKGRVYEVTAEPSKPPIEKPPEFVALEPILLEKGFVKNEDIRRALGVSL